MVNVISGQALSPPRRNFGELRTRLPTVSGSALHTVEWWDLGNNSEVAWAFAVEREEWLELEELFVMPSYRREGYARRLLKAVAALAAALGRPWRYWVSHADVAMLGADVRDFAFAVGLRAGDVATPWFGKVLIPK